MKKIIIVGAFITLVAASGTALAFHSWGPYHWARESNPFTLKLGDNVSGAWDSVLATASTDWSASSVLDTTVVTGSTNPKNCKAVPGRAEVCNSKYGNNGWLGIAQIWITGGEHITQGVVKLNDTYFSRPAYNTTAWKNLVMCQEVGHIFGLDHQDENFSNGNLGTCMDYTNNPEPNQHPNTHDYDELASIYAHTDSFTSVLASLSASAKNSIGSDRADEHAEFGVVVKRYSNGKPAVYSQDLGGGKKVLTHVFWAE